MERDLISPSERVICEWRERGSHQAIEKRGWLPMTPWTP